MSIVFEESPHRVKIVNQRFGTSRVKGTLGFILTFRPLCQLEKPEVVLPSLLRETTFWITENTHKRVLHQLHTLGYVGSTLAGVDPDTPGFHDFSDVEIDLTCEHKPGDDGELYENWSYDDRKQNLTDKSLLRHFDRITKSEQEPVIAGSNGITDEDVPF
jgi:hypothetical protein